MKDKLVITKGLEVCASTRHGYGVFTTDFITKGDIVEECTVCIQTVPLQSGILCNYRFAGPLLSHENSEPSQRYFVIPMGYAMIYNHDTKPNLQWNHDVNNRLVVFKATRDILPGEELTHDYGPSFKEHVKL